jgi:hypothetical protein
MQWRSRLTHYDVRPFKKVSYSGDGLFDFVGQSESRRTEPEGWPSGGAEVQREWKNAVNGLKNAG